MENTISVEVSELKNPSVVWLFFLKGTAENIIFSQTCNNLQLKYKKCCRNAIIFYYVLDERSLTKQMENQVHSSGLKISYVELMMFWLKVLIDLTSKK